MTTLTLDAFQDVDAHSTFQPSRVSLISQAFRFGCQETGWFSSALPRSCPSTQLSRAPIWVPRLNPLVSYGQNFNISRWGRHAPQMRFNIKWSSEKFSSRLVSFEHCSAWLPQFFDLLLQQAFCYLRSVRLELTYNTVELIANRLSIQKLLLLHKMRGEGQY